MVERPYKCPLCHASFRNESGMMWHVSRRHEAPQALEALGKNYEEKVDKLRQDNVAQARENNDLKSELDDTKTKLLNTTINLTKEQEENITLMSQISKMTDLQTRLITALALRDVILRECSGIKLPIPFYESDKNLQTPSQPKKADL